MSKEDKPINWEETWAGQIIKQARDLSTHPTKKELGWLVFRPDIMNSMEPSMSRIIAMHPEFCEDCRTVLDSIRTEVEKRKPEFNVNNDL